MVYKIYKKPAIVRVCIYCHSRNIAFKGSIEKFDTYFECRNCKSRETLLKRED